MLHILCSYVSMEFQLTLVVNGGDVESQSYKYVYPMSHMHLYMVVLCHVL